MDKRFPAATLPHAISALVASYTSIRRKCISNSSADLPRFAGRGRVFRLDFRVNFGNDFACISLLFLLHHGRSYIYDLLIILFPYRAARPCMEASSGRWDSGRIGPNPSTGVPFPGACPATKGPACSMRSCQRSSERSGTSRMSDFVPGVRWDGAAPAELGSVVDSCVLLFLRSLLPCFLIFPVRGPSKGLVVGRGGRYSPKGLGWALWYSMVLCGTLWYSMVLYGTLWYSVVLYGTLWYSMVLYGTLWYSVVLCGTLWYSARGALVVVRASEPTSVAPLPPRGARSGSLCVSWSGTGRG
jgi:hypothetical protein